MTRIRYVKSAAALLKGKDALLLVAPKRAFDDGTFLEALPAEHRRHALELAKDAPPGLTGNAAGTLVLGAAPRKLAVGVLPDTVSRHNSATRAEAIRRVVAQSMTGRKGSAGILLVLDQADHYRAAATAIARCLPRYTAATQKAAAEPTLDVLAVGPDGAVIAADARVVEVADASREAGRLVDVPPTELDPAGFHIEVSRLTRGLTGVTKKALVGDQLVAAGLGGIHAVGRTAVSAPRLVVLTYRPKRGSKRHVALVGKGVTYDTGGLSLKPTAGMSGMKCDMGGAAAVFGAFLALVKSGAPCAVSALLCIAENAVGPTAFKNDDVLTMHSKKTVEVNNTDAEGRLLLADGVSYAARVLKADYILDAATLTGAQGVATGNLHGALVSNDEALERLVYEAGQSSGDLVHALPFAPEFYRAEFKSEVADMRNSVANRANAQVSCAAEFIHWHLDGTSAKWAHVDLAFPAWQRGRGTGYGVALLEDAVRRIVNL
ncbi:MAG: leucyl aminopeptidase family protein [Planctomycetota bacterium]